MFRKILIANRGEIAVRIARVPRNRRSRCRGLQRCGSRFLARAARRRSLSYRSRTVARKLSCHRKDHWCRALCRVAMRCILDMGFSPRILHSPAPARMRGLHLSGRPPRRWSNSDRKLLRGSWPAQTMCPPFPGRSIRSKPRACRHCKQDGFPVVLKAVAGGGGKGMRLVEREAELAGAWRDATSEAKNAFGDGRLYLEKYLLRPRHMEIQVLGDHAATWFIWANESARSSGVTRK